MYFRYQCTGCDAAFSNSVDRDRHTAKKHTIPKSVFCFFVQGDGNIMLIC